MPPPPDLAYAPALLVVADTPAAAARARAAAQASGIAVAVSLSLAEAAAHLEGGAVPNLVLLEIDGDAPMLETLLSIFEAAASTRYPSIVSTPAALIDLVAACAPNARVQLADATDADRIEALGLARTPAATGVREPRAAVAPTSATDATQDPDLAAQIRNLLRARRLRARYFDPALFADPAWDMLLDLMAARLDRTRIAVSSLCIAAAVPPTTALRWIKTLTDCGLCARVADPADGRRVFIDLSDEAADALRAYLAEIRRAS